MEPLDQQFLDPMHFGGYVDRRKSCDLSNGGCIGILQVQNNDLAVEWSELLNQCEQSAKRLLLVKVPLLIAAVRRIADLLEADERRGSTPAPNHLRCGDVVGDTIHPGPHRAFLIEAREATPQRHMNLLEQIPAPLRVVFVRPRKSFERRSVEGAGFGVEALLPGAFAVMGRHQACWSVIPGIAIF